MRNGKTRFERGRCKGCGDGWQGGRGTLAGETGKRGKYRGRAGLQKARVPPGPCGEGRRGGTCRRVPVLCCGWRRHASSARPRESVRLGRWPALYGLLSSHVTATEPRPCGTGTRSWKARPSRRSALRRSVRGTTTLPTKVGSGCCSTACAQATIMMTRRSCALAVFKPAQGVARTRGAASGRGGASSEGGQRSVGAACGAVQCSASPCGNERCSAAHYSNSWDQAPPAGISHSWAWQAAAALAQTDHMQRGQRRRANPTCPAGSSCTHTCAATLDLLYQDGGHTGSGADLHGQVQLHLALAAARQRRRQRHIGPPRKRRRRGLQQREQRTAAAARGGRVFGGRCAACASKAGQRHG